MKSILVPVDFSPASKNAFQYAVRLAHAFKARVTLLHVYSAGELDPFVPISMQQALIDAQESVAMEYFTSLKKEISSEILRDIALDFQIVIGPAAEQILYFSEESNPSLIIMGMRGGNIFAQKVLGNTATHVIQRSKYPIVIVPESFSYTPIKRIGYATNFEQEDIYAIGKVQEFAEKLGADIQCIHIPQNGNTEDNYKLDILKSAYRHEFPLNPIDFETLSYENVIKGLNHYAEAQKLDLLVMLTHSRGLFSQLFHHSTTKEMILQSKVPLWVFQKGIGSLENDGSMKQNANL